MNGAFHAQFPDFPLHWAVERSGAWTHACFFLGTRREPFLRLLYAPAAVFPAGISGRAVVALLVDVNGMPQQVHVSCSLGAGFDENAVKAVKQYRFEPARLKRKPVPAKVSVEILFQR